jgi:hypothetical protein
MAKQTVGHSHVVLAHGPVLEAPAFAIVIDELCSLAGEEQGFLVVLKGTQDGKSALSGRSCPKPRTQGLGFAGRHEAQYSLIYFGLQGEE